MTGRKMPFSGYQDSSVGSRRGFPENIRPRTPKCYRRCCLVVPIRLRITLAPLIERWFYKIAPIARKSLWKAARGTLARFGSTARRAIDQPLYTMLSELVGHDDGALLRSFAMIMWRGMKRDAAASRASLFPVLFTDVILGTKLQSANSARRIAGVLDMAVTTGSWGSPILHRFKSAMKLGGSHPPTNAPMEGQSFTTLSIEKLQRGLENSWKQLEKADKSKLFAVPVTNLIVFSRDLSY